MEETLMEWKKYKVRPRPFIAVVYDRDYWDDKKAKYAEYASVEDFAKNHDYAYSRVKLLFLEQAEKDGKKGKELDEYVDALLHNKIRFADALESYGATLGITVCTPPTPKRTLKQVGLLTLYTQSNAIFIQYGDQPPHYKGKANEPLDQLEALVAFDSAVEEIYQLSKLDTRTILQTREDFITRTQQALNKSEKKIELEQYLSENEWVLSYPSAMDAFNPEDFRIHNPLEYTLGVDLDLMKTLSIYGAPLDIKREDGSTYIEYVLEYGNPEDNRDSVETLRELLFLTRNGASLPCREQGDDALSGDAVENLTKLVFRYISDEKFRKAVPTTLLDGIEDYDQAVIQLVHDLNVNIHEMRLDTDRPQNVFTAAIDAHNSSFVELLLKNDVDPFLCTAYHPMTQNPLIEAAIKHDAESFALIDDFAEKNRRMSEEVKRPMYTASLSATLSDGSIFEPAARVIAQTCLERGAEYWENAVGCTVRYHLNQSGVSETQPLSHYDVKCALVTPDVPESAAARTGEKPFAVFMTKNDEVYIVDLDNLDLKPTVGKDYELSVGRNVKVYLKEVNQQDHKKSIAD